MRASRLVLPLVLVASGLAFLSCGGDGNGPTGGVPTVQISPDTDSLVIGATATLQATVRDASGSVVQNAQVFWNTENPQVATVSDQGVVTAVGLGTVRIAASSQGHSALASITVIPKPVASVTVSPSSKALTVGQTIHLQATTLDANGTALTGRAVTWSSNNTAVATVDETGLVSALAPGSATITATSEGKSGTAAITVSLPTAASVSLDKTTDTITVTQTVQLTATVKDANGAAISGAPVTWTSSVPGVATVSASGLVTGVSVGSTTITARSGNATKTALVIVIPVPANKVVISPNSKALFVGDTATLTAVVTDASGDVLTGRTIAWSSSNTSVATVSSAGLVTAVAAGSATITATSEGKSGTAAITVNPVPIASLTVDPDAASLYQGRPVQLQATPKDAQGNALAGRTITWSTSNAGIASLSATTGSAVTVTATATGTSPVSAVITAKCEGFNAAATITVLPVPVASVTVSPSSASIAVGDSAQFTVMVRDSDDNVLTGRRVTWQSSNSGVATASGTGTTRFVKAVAQGSATIIATSEGASGTADVTVTPAPVASVAIAPTDTTIFVGTTGQLRVTLKDAGGNVLNPNGRTVTWSSTATGIATVDASGVVTGVSAGQAKVIATSEGKSDTASVTVAVVPVDTVTVAPVDTSIFVGDKFAMRVTLKDSHGNTLTGRTITWSSSDNSIASIDASTGDVTGNAAGGPITITATSEGKTGSTTVRVNPVPVSSVLVSPTSDTIVVGDSAQFTATPRDASANALTGRAVTWESSAPGVATVSSTGMVHAVADGSATITATSETVSGTATVTVAPAPVAPVATVTVSPDTATITVGDSVTLSATLLDSLSNVLTGRTVTWSSSDDSVATVGQTTGVVTALAPGTATITATSEGKNGASTVTVNPATPPGR